MLCGTQYLWNYITFKCVSFRSCYQLHVRFEEIAWDVANGALGPLLVAWIYFNPCTDK